MSLASSFDKRGQVLRWGSVVLLLGFFGVSFYYQTASGIMDAEKKSCGLEAPDNIATESDKQGQLRIVVVSPTRSAINKRVCITVAGVVAESVENRIAEKLDNLKKLVTEAEAKVASAGSADVAKKDEAARALVTARQNLDAALSGTTAVATTQLKVFLNDQPAEALALPALSIARPQALLLDLRSTDDATATGAKVWNALLRGSVVSALQNEADKAEEEKKGQKDTRDRFQSWVTEKNLTIGLSRASTAAPEATSSPIKLVVFSNWVAVAGVLSFGAFALFVLWLARNTSILRDDDRLVGEDDRNRRTSQLAANLSLAQAALESAAAAHGQLVQAMEKAKTDATSAVPQVKADAETLLKEIDAKIAAAAEKLKSERAAHTVALRNLEAHAAKKSDGLPSGAYSLARVQVAIWVVLVIGGYLFLWSTLGHFNGLITDTVLYLLGINGLAAIASIEISKSDVEKRGTTSFHEDILNEGQGPSLHRLQAISWTLILAALFLWNVIGNFRFIDFDVRLLLLLGISQGMYLGFKYQQVPAKS